MSGRSVESLNLQGIGRFSEKRANHGLGDDAGPTILDVNLITPQL